VEAEYEHPSESAATNPTTADADGGLLLIDASGSTAPVDLRALVRTSKSLPLNQRFARLWDVSESTVGRIKLEQDLRRGIERDEFEVHLQPQADLSTGQVVGAEALVRWQHPERGLLLPQEFIPVAEDSGLIVPLGERVLRIACEQAVQRERLGLPSVRIGVNLSAVQFHEPGLAAMVSSALDESGLDPRLLELEITETTAMRHAELTIKVMHSLTSLGITLSLDDFGTGYSSLQYLKEFPLDGLKVDQSFVSCVTSDRNSAAIVAAVVAIGHALGLRVIAEGIETAAQLTSVKERGCDWYQGFLLGRPMSGEAFDAILGQRAVKGGAS
jgi:EAL domain-containing protein (putative c-di-GMP-specific phosphodiesterase class I)